MHKKKHILIIASLEQWRKDKLTSAWLWIPIEKAYVIPIAAELGKELILYNYETCFFFVLKDLFIIMLKKEWLY